MSLVGTAPPEYVLAAFGVLSREPSNRLGNSGRVWRSGDVVFKSVGDPVCAAWAASVFDSLRISGVRIARPTRSLDGRWVVGGWSAERFVSGRPGVRVDDMVRTSFLVDRALAGTPEPKFLTSASDDRANWADRLAWQNSSTADRRLGSSAEAELWRRIAAGRVRVDLPNQIIHAELFGNVLFAGSAPPAVIDFVPLWRPANYAAAVALVDAVAWGDAPVDSLRRWRELPSWEQLVRRAILYRLAYSLVHPRSTPESLAAIVSVARALDPSD